jgi:hypothetical protein
MPEVENRYEQEARYGYIKGLVEKFAQEEIWPNRIFRLIFRQEGLLTFAQFGELYPIYRKPIYAILETAGTFVIVSKDCIYSPLGICKKDIVDVLGLKLAT